MAVAEHNVQSEDIRAARDTQQTEGIRDDRKQTAK